MARQSLLLRDQDHSQRLPDAPHDDQALLARFFKTLDGTSFWKEANGEDGITDGDNECVEDVPTANLATCRILHILMAPDKFDPAGEVDANEEVQDELEYDEHGRVRHLEAIKNCDEDQSKAENEQANVEPATLFWVVDLLEDEVELIVSNAQ